MVPVRNENLSIELIDADMARRDQRQVKKDDALLHTFRDSRSVVINDKGDTGNGDSER